MRLVEFVTCRVPPGTTEAVNTIAEADGVSPSEVLRRAIVADVERRKENGSRSSEAASAQAQAA